MVPAWVPACPLDGRGKVQQAARARCRPGRPAGYSYPWRAPRAPMPRHCPRPNATRRGLTGSWPPGRLTMDRPAAPPRPAPSRGCSSRRCRPRIRRPPTTPRPGGWRRWSAGAGRSSTWLAPRGPCWSHALRCQAGRICAMASPRSRERSSACASHYKRGSLLWEPRRQAIIEVYRN